MTIDFGDGQKEKTITLDEKVQIHYKIPGNKIIKTKLTFDDNTSYSSISVIDVEYDQIQTDVQNSILTTNLSISEEGTVTGREYLGKSASVNYSILLAPNNDILDKPFIVVEGFDPVNFYDIDQLSQWFDGVFSIGPNFLLGNMKNF